MSTGADLPAPADAPQQADQAQPDQWVLADLAYNEAKPGALQRAADNAMRDEIMLRIVLQEASL